MKNVDKGTTKKQASSSRHAQTVGKYGTSTPGPIFSMSNFIQSALSSHSSAEKNTEDDSIQEDREEDIRSPVESGSLGKNSTSAKKQGSGRQRYGERSSRARKKLKLGKASVCSYQMLLWWSRSCNSRYK